MLGDAQPKREGSVMCRFCWHVIDDCECDSHAEKQPLMPTPCINPDDPRCTHCIQLKSMHIKDKRERLICPSVFTFSPCRHENTCRGLESQALRCAKCGDPVPT